MFGRLAALALLLVALATVGCGDDDHEGPYHRLEEPRIVSPVAGGSKPKPYLDSGIDDDVRRCEGGILPGLTESEFDVPYFSDTPRNPGSRRLRVSVPEADDGQGVSATTTADNPGP